MVKSNNKNLNIILALAVFVCGACVMIVELIGSRLLAPYVGTSLIPWTTLIGVILGSLSVGYWFGGRLADIKPSKTKFGFIIMLAALAVALLLWQSLALKIIAPWLISVFNLSFTALLSSIFLFFIPSFLLGMITPYALRLALVEINDAGKIAGSLYACSTLGSIAGTFLAGFVLIPLWGSFISLACVAIVLAILSSIFLKSSIAKFFLIFLILSVLPTWYNPALFYANHQVISDQESFYNRLFVVKDIDRLNNRPLLSIMSGPHLSQSARFTDGTNELVYDYTKFFRLVDYFVPANNKVLMIGGGAYSVPRDYLVHNATATIDVAEIDPLYTSIARQYFNLQDDSRLNIYHEDARLFLENKTSAYDAIFVDAFNGSGSVPFHLATIEAVEKIYTNLNDEGVVIVNLISSLEGPSSDFIKSEYATYNKIFDQVKIYPLGDDPKNIQNVMLVALKNSSWPTNLPQDPELVKFLNHEVIAFKAGNRILTDDWAPVDYFLAGVF